MSGDAVRSAFAGRVERLESGETRYRLESHPVKRGEAARCVLRDHKRGLVIYGPAPCLECARECTALSTPADVLVTPSPRGQLSFLASDAELVQGVC